jgi:MFS transporter, DHA1 family, tetracycline resistance protein
MSARALIVLFILAFLDVMAFGLVYPLFSSMLFDDAKWNFVPSSTTETIRGLWLGILISAAPIAQMIVSPFAGNLSDRIGRKAVMLGCLCFGLLGSLGAIIAIEGRLLYLLAFSRVLTGISIASLAVANAAVADVSTKEEKGQHYAYLSMAYGLGFACGPFVGGFFSAQNQLWGESLTRPFYVHLVCMIINILMIFYYFPETCTKDKRSQEQSLQFFQFLKTFYQENKRAFYLLLATFAYCFGWSFYVDLIPVWWVRQLHLSTTQIGWYFSYGALCYVFFTGCVVGVVSKRYDKLTLLRYSAFSYVGTVWILFFVNNALIFWILIPLQNVAAAFFFPIMATVISESASNKHQGRIMGLYTSFESLGSGIAPVIAGPFVGVHLLSPAAIGGLFVLFAGMFVTRARKFT